MGRIFTNGTRRLDVLALLAVAGATSGCAAMQVPAMSVEEHHREAARLDTEAGEIFEDLDGAAVYQGHRYVWGISFGDVNYDETTERLRRALNLRRDARAHREAIEEAERLEEAMCQSSPHHARDACPLTGRVWATEEIDGGVRLSFADDANVDAAMSDVRCYLVHGRTSGHHDVESCPFHVPGLEVHQSTPLVLELTVDGASAIEELRRRTRPTLL